MRHTCLAALATAIVLCTGSAAHAQCVAPSSVSGHWVGSDNADYYVRSAGNDMFWLGMSRDDGRSFTNVFHGTRQGNLVSGSWGDVRGASHNAGTVSFRISGTAFMEKTGGNFPVQRSGRGGCNDTQ